MPTWYEERVEKFMDTHVRSTKINKEVATEALEIELQVVGTRMLMATMAQLMEEIPYDSVAWRTSEKEYKAKDMIAHLTTETPEGKQFATDLLRVARDLIQKAANER